MNANPAFSEALPLSLYVHIPWCVRKCPYCDFNSHPVDCELPEQAYVDALVRDLEQDLPLVWGRRALSLFIGGGTPSLLSPESIDRLLSAVRARLPMAPDLEVTLEANPGTVEVGRFRELHAAGISRLSIGVQSFNERALKAIGRIHDAVEAQRAGETAHAAGFDDFNLDIMYGLPGQDGARALSDIKQAVALAPAHISHYQLTLEPNTLFHHSPPTLPDEDTVHVIEETCRGYLAGAGYQRYEVSAYAQSARRCVHNLNYWEFGDYLGIGAGAHGKLTDEAAGTVVRRAKRRHPRAYLDAAVPVSEERSLCREDLLLEFMLNALRLVDGFSPALFTARTGLTLDDAAPALARAQECGLVQWDTDRIRATPTGLRFLDDTVALFLPQKKLAQVSGHTQPVASYDAR